MGFNSTLTPRRPVSRRQIPRRLEKAAGRGRSNTLCPVSDSTNPLSAGPHRFDIGAYPRLCLAALASAQDRRGFVVARKSRHQGAIWTATEHPPKAERRLRIPAFRQRRTAALKQPCPQRYGPPQAERGHDEPTTIDATRRPPASALNDSMRSMRHPTRDAKQTATHPPRLHFSKPDKSKMLLRFDAHQKH